MKSKLGLTVYVPRPSGGTVGPTIIPIFDINIVTIFYIHIKFLVLFAKNWLYSKLYVLTYRQIPEKSPERPSLILKHSVKSVKCLWILSEISTIWLWHSMWNHGSLTQQNLATSAILGLADFMQVTSVGIHCRHPCIYFW